MDSPERVSAERIASLAGAAAAALAARNALRVLPAFIPERRSVVEYELRAAFVSCLIAAYSALASRDRYHLDAIRLHQAMRSSAKGSALAAYECVRAALSASFADMSRPAVTILASSIESYRHVAERADVGGVFEASLARDLIMLESEPSEVSAVAADAVSAGFFSRRLYDPHSDVPKPWVPVIEQWARTLEANGASDIFELYRRMCDGAEVGAPDLSAAIDAWLLGDGSTQGRPEIGQRGESAAAVVEHATPDFAAPPAPAAVGEPPTPPRPPDVWMLSDKPLEDHFSLQDRFQFTDYADALAAILDHEKTGTPFTMAINAPWGAGKTTLANMIAAQLEQRPKDRGQAPHIICRFNAWMHDDAPNLATAFISEVSRTANRHRHALLRLVQPLPSALLEPNKRRWRRLSIFLVVLLITTIATILMGEHLLHLDAQRKYEDARRTAYQATKTVTTDVRSGQETLRTASETVSQSRDTDPPPKPPLSDGFDRWLSGFHSRMMALGAFFTAVAGVIGVLTTVLTRIVTATSLGRFVENPEKAAEAGAIQSAERQLKRLIKQATWRGNRFVVFVDDIERCRPPRSVDVLDAINQLMDHKNVVVVLLGDMSAVAAAAQLKYRDLAAIYVPSAGIAASGADHSAEAFGRLYLQKIIQFQFDLPIPPREKIRDYMGRLAVTPELQGGERVPAAT